MENPEEVLHSLDEFAKLKPRDIPNELEEYLLYVASSGDPVYQWSLIKCLFRQKLLNVVTEFNETCPLIEMNPCPNVDPFNYEIMKTSLLERFDAFASAPFTIQRLSELLTTPRKQYNRVDKFMRAIEKNIWVVSTREPGRRESTVQETAMATTNLVNGVAAPTQAVPTPTPPAVQPPVPVPRTVTTTKRTSKIKIGISLEERIKSGHPQLIDDDEDEEEEEETTEDSEEQTTDESSQEPPTVAGGQVADDVTEPIVESDVVGEQVKEQSEEQVEEQVKKQVEEQAEEQAELSVKELIEKYENKEVEKTVEEIVEKGDEEVNEEEKTEEEEVKDVTGYIVNEVCALEAFEDEKEEEEDEEKEEEKEEEEDKEDEEEEEEPKEEEDSNKRKREEEDEEEESPAKKQESNRILLELEADVSTSPDDTNLEAALTATPAELLEKCEEGREAEGSEGKLRMEEVEERSSEMIVEEETLAMDVDESTGSPMEGGGESGEGEGREGEPMDECETGHS